MPTLQYDSLVHVPFVGATSPPLYINGQSCEPIYLQSFQFPNDAVRSRMPVTAAVETITVDKWFRRTEVPIFKPRRLVQYGVNCGIAIEDAPALPAVPAVYINGQSCEPIYFQNFQCPTDAVRSRLPIAGGGPPPANIYINGQSCEPIYLRHFQCPIEAVRSRMPIAGPVISTQPAVWQNLATVTLTAADLDTVILKLEDIGLINGITSADLDTVSLLTESNAVVTVTYEDNDTVDIKYEDNDTV